MTSLQPTFVQFALASNHNSTKFAGRGGSPWRPPQSPQSPQSPLPSLLPPMSLPSGSLRKSMDNKPSSLTVHLY